MSNTNTLSSDILQKALQNTLTALTDALPEKYRDEFLDSIEAGDGPAVQKFLETHLPGYLDIVIKSSRDIEVPLKEK